MFVCGVTFQGTSLNNKLLQGPNLTSSLLGVLVCIRVEPVAYMGDIQAMLHQVKLAKEDKNYLCFLWWPDGNLSQDLVEYRMTTPVWCSFRDDCLKSSATEEEAVETVRVLIALCRKGGFILEKWVSNSRVLLQSIAEEKRAQDLKELDLDRDKFPNERALGLQWSTTMVYGLFQGRDGSERTVSHQACFQSPA